MDEESRVEFCERPPPSAKPPPSHLNGILESPQVVPVGELDHGQLVLPFQVLNPLFTTVVDHVGGSVVV